jgi:prolyl oligopeptidase
MTVVLSRRAALVAAGLVPLSTLLPRLGHAQGSAARLPVAAVRNVPETFFGTVVDDPYRYFENTQDPEVAAWMKAHSDHAHATLKGITGRDALRRRLEELDASAAARVVSVQRVPGARGTVYFYQGRGPQDDQLKLFVRQGAAGPARLLFDPETLKKRTGKPHAINYVAPSPDGRWVALGVSASGSEDASMRILDVASGRQVGPELPRVQWGAVSWTPDSRELFFHRMQALKKGQPATDKYQSSLIYSMKPGAGEKGLKLHVRAGDPAASGGLDIPITEFPFFDVQPDGRIVAYSFDGVSPEVVAWHSTLAALRAGKPAWQPLCTKADGVTTLAVMGSRVAMLTHRDAPRYRMIGGPIEGFSPAKAQVLVPESERVLAGLGAAADALYLEARDGNVKRLFKMAHRDGAPLEEVKLPVVGAFTLGSGARPELPGVVIDLESWTRARQIFEVAADGSVRNTGLQPSGRFDAPADVVATEVMVKSHDGVMVPMSIIHRSGVKLDGRNPTILYGYASYGITEEPFFSYSRLAWMEQGGVFAVANPRGSGVFGKQWHDDGKKAKKPNTWRDFIACAEYLVAQGWTQPARLGIWGGSAGGILVGRAMTERPDLFGVVLPQVGSLDNVRAETTPNGVPNIPEFGTRTKEDEFRALLAMSTYHQVKDGTRYPAVLLTHGVNDPRVEVWNSTKTAARLLAASTSGKPVLLRLDYQSGHGVGSTKAQVLDERADLFAFVLWQMGVAGFAPKA